MSQSNREIVLSRHFSAPRDLVFEAWTRPDFIDRWWGPRAFTTHTTSMEVRPGGAWIFEMRSAEYGNFPNRVRYLEVVPSEKLVYDHDAGKDNDPAGFHVVVTFTAVADGTTVEMRTTLASEEALANAKKFGAIEGGQQTLERLGENLSAAAEQDLVIVRVLRAPVARVWRAWSDPAQLALWWGPKGFSMEVASLDLRPGGVFHYAMSAPGGDMGKMWGKFVFTEVVPQQRIVYISSFSDEHQGIVRHPMAPTWPAEVHNSLSFVADGDRTVLTLRGRPIRATEEELALFAGARSNVQQGFKGTLDQLEAFLAEG
ncbi:MAG TPA: SRPBCC family protein [Myxococcota bacterium]|nr:SRPBCC family protein [Myxococcota bacterium]HND29442.1 SRPBCC family protein [Myxococcota bacterium]